MKKVMIVESPAKIKTISKFLGKDFVILSTMGHIKDLPPKKIGVQVGKTVELEYEFLDKKKKLVADLCKAAQTADEIFVAPDPDREGEIIAWHIAQEIEKCASRKTPVHRISFNEITQPAVEAAIKNRSTINLDLVRAQQARRVLDRWVGYEVSPILWKKIARGLSAGRVQSVALRLVCEREEEIKKFKTEEYWTIHLTFKIDDGSTFAALLSKVGPKKAAIPDQKSADQTKKQLLDEDFSVSAIKESERKKSAPPPFITSTLQQSAYNALGFSVQKTMQIAQKLYEGITLGDHGSPVALITYMRTDSTRISDIAIKAVRSFVSSHFGAQYVPEKPHLYAKKGKSQDAHEAVRPVDVTRTPESVARFLTPDMLKLYTLVWKRFVACQMAPAVYAQKQVTIKGGKFECRAAGSTLLFDGYSVLYAKDGKTLEDEGSQAAGEDDESSAIIPQSLSTNSALALKDVAPKQHFTQPPARFSEATLVKDMEKNGIGRPSTYATILKTIQARAYSSLDTKKRFVPTELGIAVIAFLTQHFPELFDVTFTASMEKDLDRIAKGELDRDKLLLPFYKTFQKTIETVAEKDPKKTAQITDLVCPSCKKEKLVIRFGRTGPFVGCSAYPDCTFTSNFERAEDGTITLIKQETKTLDISCPQCGKPLRTVRGRYGMFISCSGYPDCTYIHQEKAPFPCPLCSANLVKRSFKGQAFWGCSGYPACTYTIRGAVVEEPCALCAFPYTLSEGTKKVCPNPACTAFPLVKRRAVQKKAVKPDVVTPAKIRASQEKTAKPGSVAPAKSRAKKKP